MRRQFPRFGPKKIRAKLRANGLAGAAGGFDGAKGLAARRDRGRRDRADGESSIDFKGWFRTRDGTRCDPLRSGTRRAVI